MRTIIQLQQALRKLDNVAQFARDHKLPHRTIWRIRAGGKARDGTIAIIDAALNKAKDKP